MTATVAMASGTYWSRTGRQQAEYNQLWERLVPESGMSEFTCGELLRAASRLYYDYYNNGGCNFEIYRYFIELIDQWEDEITPLVDRRDFRWMLAEMRRHARKLEGGDGMYIYREDGDARRKRMESTLESIMDAVVTIVRAAVS